MFTLMDKKMLTVLRPKFLGLIAYAQKTPLCGNANVISVSGGIHLDLSLQLHTNFVCSSLEGSGKSTLLCRLA